MHLWIVVASLAVLANGATASVADFEFTAQRDILVTPQAVSAESLVEAKFEPTKHELRVGEFPAEEKWEQGFLLAARLPVDDAFLLRQDIRTGLQTETVLGDALSFTYRDALALLEKTSAELRASEALRLAASIQQQWLANNRVPFAEIVTYGTEAVARPAKNLTLKLQAEWQEHAEFAGAVAEQQAYRLAIEEELVPKKLKASAGAALVDSEDATGREISERKWDAALFWSPNGDRTALTLSADLADREITCDPQFADGTSADRMANYHVKLRQRLFARSQIELQAGRETPPLQAVDGLPSADAWSLGANSDFFLREGWNAALGLRYRLQDDSPSPAPADEFSLTLSLRGLF
jgi:hypothetical protein